MKSIDSSENKRSLAIYIFTTKCRQNLHVVDFSVFCYCSSEQQ